jgi:hypothetical protein
LLLSRSWLAETLDADRGVGKARGDLQRAAKGLDIASQIADIDVGTLLQLGNSQCGSRVPVGQKGLPRASADTHAPSVIGDPVNANQGWASREGHFGS